MPGRRKDGNEMRTIRVTGKGQIKVKPDVTRLTITCEGTYKEYGDALKHSSEDTEKLNDLFERFGFDRTDLKTLSFNVDTEYESYQERNVWKQRFKGYRFSHIMKVEFSSDNDRLGKILYALSKSPVKPQFRISYTISDPEGAKNELLGKAIADAKVKAAVLTEAAGVALKDIQTIDYSWGEISFEMHPTQKLMSLADYGAGMEEDCSYDMDIEPDDIRVSDTVTVVCEIA